MHILGRQTCRQTLVLHGSTKKSCSGIIELYQLVQWKNVMCRNQVTWLVFWIYDIHVFEIWCLLIYVLIKEGQKKYWPKKCKSSYPRDLSASPISTSNWFIDYTCTCRCLELCIIMHLHTWIDLRLRLF